NMVGVSSDTSLMGGGFSCPTVSGATGVFVCSGSPVIAPNQPDQQWTITVDVGSGTPSLLEALFDFDGGGALDVVHTARPVVVSATPTLFGIDAFDAGAMLGGVPITQAGGHPDALATSIDFTTHTDPNPLTGDMWPIEDAKDVIVELPPGLVGNPTGVSESTHKQLINGETQSRPLCPATSQVGLVSVRMGGVPFC